MATFLPPSACNFPAFRMEYDRPLLINVKLQSETVNLLQRLDGFGPRRCAQNSLSQGLGSESTFIQDDLFVSLSAIREDRLKTPAAIVLQILGENKTMKTFQLDDLLTFGPSATSLNLDTSIQWKIKRY